MLNESRNQRTSNEFSFFTELVGIQLLLMTRHGAHPRGERVTAEQLDALLGQAQSAKAR
jgi:hypothetical protein